MRKLPIGIQSFVEIRTENYYYVDKTPFVKKLVDEGKYYFLSRPRRFGKSLFLDTLRQAFLGRKELFKGLYLENNWNWSVKYPVIYISFGAGVHRKPEELIQTQEAILQRHKEKYQIELKYPGIKEKFFELIQRLREKFNQKVVVLIDEYDKPILDNITKPEVATEMREILKNFYSVLKDADEFLKFVFITGVSKFSKVSIFSGLNNLEDITLNPSYGTICGYTQKELEVVFEDLLKGLDLKEVKRWYNGYNFLSEPVYNPFDILLLLKNRRFRSYWFETGTPTFLIKLLLEKKIAFPSLERLVTGEEILESFDVDRIYPETILFQTGYLTIKDVYQTGPMETFELSYPNLEVKMSFNNFLLTTFIDLSVKQKGLRDIYLALSEGEVEKLKEVFRGLFASIPYNWFQKNNLEEYEGFYGSVFYAYFSALGLDLKVEEMTNQGRLDMAVIFGERAYIFEFKVVDSGATHQAIKQLKEKKYWEKYSKKYKEVYLIGIEFSKQERNIVSFEVERI